MSPPREPRIPSRHRRAGASGESNRSQVAGAVGRRAGADGQADAVQAQVHGRGGWTIGGVGSVQRRPPVRAASAQPSDLLAALAGVRVAAKQVGGLAEAGQCDG